MALSDIKDAVWLNTNHTRLDCMYKDKVYGWVPFTADANDKSEISTYIFDNLGKIDIGTYTPKTKPLDVLKEEKHQELKRLRDEHRLNDSFKYDNDYFTANKEDDQNNMNTLYIQAIAMIAGTIERGVFVWMSATNTEHTFNPEQIVTLANMMRDHVQNIYKRYWYARDVLLAKALTPEEVAAITFPDSIPT